ncbi:hypothetical protein FDF76_13040 [Clostridium botulinum]|nr:hypothetical protein [Clostridium botulinum]NFF37411.1 hypothetical protein [Clostridium botulinum]NFI49523.1 hypothetical protein [Clostridium botulinum]NFI60082.1 hypothetical protein [Clostridium botulinum]NFI69506.1 hypothetical protein [Clostridium botulinum]
MLNYIIAVNKDKKYPVILDYETNDKDCEPDVGYITEFDDWETDKEEYMDENCFFNEKVLSESGIYKIEGYDSYVNTPDGWYDGYKVTKITKLSKLPY